MNDEKMLKLGIAALLTGVLIAFCGCTSTTVQYGKTKFSRISFLQSVDVCVSVDGDKATITYSNDGGGKTAGAMAGAAASTLIK